MIRFRCSAGEVPNHSQWLRCWYLSSLTIVQAAHSELNVPAADAELVLFTGRFVPLKGLRELLEALAVLISSRPSLRLVCIGEGPMDREVRQRASQPDLEGHVEFTGPAGRTSSRAMACRFRCILLAQPFRRLSQCDYRSTRLRATRSLQQCRRNTRAGEFTLWDSRSTSKMPDSLHWVSQERLMNPGIKKKLSDVFNGVGTTWRGKRTRLSLRCSMKTDQPNRSNSMPQDKVLLISCYFPPAGRHSSSACFEPRSLPAAKMDSKYLY